MSQLMSRRAVAIVLSLSLGAWIGASSAAFGQTTRPAGDLLATWEVSPSPQKGQDWRASGNQNLAVHPRHDEFVWEVEADKGEVRKILFGARKDVSFGNDPTVADDLEDGALSKGFNPQGIYLGGVRGATKPFKVRVYGRESKKEGLRLDAQALVTSLSNSWNDKSGRAVRWEMADSFYRMYRPATSTTPEGGLLITAKLDHDITLAKDDHARVSLEYDAGGKLIRVTISDVEVGADKKPLDTRELAKNLAEIGPDGAKVAAGVTVVSETLSLFEQGVEKWGQSGGRAQFADVLKHAVNHIHNAVKK